MLVRLLYASRSRDVLTQDLADAILQVARQHNPTLGITGLLCMCPTSQIFMQVLEGGRDVVNQLYAKIAADGRHKDVVLLQYEEITERRFAGWTMGQVNLARVNPSTLLKYSEKPALDPYAVSGKVSMALLQELIDTACITTHRGN